VPAAWRLCCTFVDPLSNPGGTVRLAAFSRLDHALFERLLELLGRTLAAARTVQACGAAPPPSAASRSC
jgi:hypothetical protein